MYQRTHVGRYMLVFFFCSIFLDFACSIILNQLDNWQFTSTYLCVYEIFWLLIISLNFVQAFQIKFKHIFTTYRLTSCMFRNVVNFLRRLKQLCQGARICLRVHQGYILGLLPTNSLHHTPNGRVQTGTQLSMSKQGIKTVEANH